MAYSGWQRLVRGWLKRRRLGRLVNYSRVSEEEGLNLIAQAQGVVVIGQAGSFNRQNFSYLFAVNGSSVYFESPTLVPVTSGFVISTKLIETPV